MTAIDSRRRKIHRATLLRDHFGIPAERVILVEADVLTLEPHAYGQCDVVLLLGSIDHLEQTLEGTGSRGG